MHRFDVKTIKNRKTTKAIKLRSICIDLTSKRSKMLSYVAKHSKQRKTTKLVKLQWIASIWCQNVESKHRKTTKAIKFRSICIDLTSKRSKMLSYVAKHSKQRKTTKLIKLQWIASIWCQNDQKSQNYKSNQIRINLHRFEVKTIKMLRYVAKLQKWSNYNELHWFDVKTFKTFELGRKTTKVIKLQWSASIWHQNNQKCRVTS